MPTKKNKNQPRNPFYFYMVSLRPQLERQGVVLENGMQTLAELAGPRWKDLPEHEKEVYQEMARQAKTNRRHGAPRNDRMDCTGEFISKRVDTVSLNESKRRKQREEVKSTWSPGKLVCDEKFYMIGFMLLLPDNGELPCEVGVAEFSLNGGILNTLHRFIRPGEIPLGYRYTAMSNSEKSHKIPINGLAKEEDTWRRILLDILKFVNPEGRSVFPPVYSRASETKQTEACLDWLARNAEMSNKLKKVYELEGFICDLYSHINQATDFVGISKSQAMDLISSTVFDFEPGARCEWHEQQEVKFCALGTAKRYCYCMADVLCPRYGIPLTPAHVPERPEGTFCTTLNAEASVRPSVSHNSTPRGQPTAWAGDEDLGPFAARDYRYKGMRAAASVASSDAGDDYDRDAGLYHRSGPTYDMQCLQTGDAPQTTPTPEQQEQFLQQQRVQQQQRQQQQQQFAQGSSAAGVRPVGRGRGRGRGAAINQPLRRPNVPGMAPPATVPGRGSATPGSWADPGASHGINEAGPTDIPSWAVVSMGRGSARAPTSKPKVYAGAANAPHPSFAPPPPLNWQQEDQYSQQYPSLPASNGVLRGNGTDRNDTMTAMMSQMNTRDFF